MCGKSLAFARGSQGPRIVVVGGLNMDLILQVPHLPRQGRKRQRRAALARAWRQGRQPGRGRRASRRQREHGRSGRPRRVRSRAAVDAARRGGVDPLGPRLRAADWRGVDLRRRQRRQLHRHRAWSQPGPAAGRCPPAPAAGSRRPGGRSGSAAGDDSRGAAPGAPGRRADGAECRARAVAPRVAATPRGRAGRQRTGGRGAERRGSSSCQAPKPKRPAPFVAIRTRSWW